MSAPWEEIQIGAETGRIELLVTEQMIDEYVASMENADPWFSGHGTPFGGRIAPPDMLPKLAMNTLFQEYLHRVIGPNIRAKQAFKFFAPIRPGMRVRAVGRVAEKYERRERRFVTLEALFTDEAGRPLVLDRRTQLVLTPDFQMRK